MTWDDLAELIPQAKADNAKFDDIVRVEVFDAETRHFRNDKLVEVDLVKDGDGPLGEWILKPVKRVELSK